MSLTTHIAIALCCAVCVAGACDASEPESTPDQESPTGSEQVATPANLEACTLSDVQHESSGTAQDLFELRVISPPSGTDVHRSTVLVVDLSYEVAKFEQGKFLVLAAVETEAGGTLLGEKYAVVHARGHLRLCLPLEDVWTIEEVTWPLTVHFALLQNDDGRFFPVIPHDLSVTYPSPEAPVGRARPLELDEPKAYVTALTKIHNLFETMLEQKKLCSERFPELATSVTMAYWQWEGKHAALRDEIEEYYFQRQLRRTEGDMKRAARFMDVEHGQVVFALMDQSPEALRRDCTTYASFLRNTSDPETQFAEDLALIRKYERTEGSLSPKEGLKKKERAMTTASPTQQ